MWGLLGNTILPPASPLDTSPPLAAASWSWKAGVVGYTDKCPRCSRPLREEVASVVTFEEHGRKHDYHVGCLLDSLCERASGGLAVPMQEYTGIDPHLYP